MPTPAHSDAAIEAALRGLLEARAPKSLCPSEVARSLSADEREWRALMPAVRAVAVRLAHTGTLAITRKGHPLAPDTINGGPVRFVKLAPDAV